MNKIISKHIGRFVLVYLDDILVMSRTPEEHVQHLGIVLQILRENGLKAMLSKCEFNKAELHFLGHVIGKDGVAVDPAKIAVIEKWPLPKSLKELQSFLGLANYFRKFVDHFSSVVAPLTALTGATGKGRARKPIQAVDWNNLSEEQVKAFQEIKQLLVTAPVLAIPDLNKPFQVHTDAFVAGTYARRSHCFCTRFQS